jgi:hypothetical protein
VGLFNIDKNINHL